MDVSIDGRRTLFHFFYIWINVNANRVDVDYEKTTGPIFLKFWHKFLLLSTTEIQK